MTTRDEVLAALRGAADDGLSGELLAGRLGISRVAVSKHVARLRASGYEIQAVPGTGYRLIASPDAPVPSEVEPLLQSTLWTRLEGGGVTGSTNDDARELARAGATQGSVVLASGQTSGKGRLGRTWESPGGGAYFSAILRPDVSPTDVASLALAVALGVARGLETLGATPRLKWPNDVLLGEGKLAGVLLEMAAESDRVEWVVAGVGLNIRPVEGRRIAGASYLADEVRGVRVASAVAAILDGVADTYAQWLNGGFAVLLQAYVDRFTLSGAEVCVRDIHGAVRAEGIVCGVDSLGRLLVTGAEGTSAVSAGEVTLRRPA